MDLDGAGGGDDVPMAAAGASRLFCPVPSCPCGDAARCAGWTSEATLRRHVDLHLTGHLSGDVPPAWLHARHRTRCPVCGTSVATRFGVHPSCRPEARAAAPGDGPGGRADGIRSTEALPAWTDIQAGQTPTLRHVPPSARPAWAQLLTRTLAAVATYNDERAWLELLMLPQAVLCAPVRGGRRHHKATAAFTLERVHRWQEGERSTLWTARPQPRRGNRPGLTAEEKKDLATSLGREGFDKKASTALLSQGVCPQTADTVEALRVLHPDGPQPTGPAMADLPVAPALEAELVARALRSFPAETAPGPSGLRIQHFRECLGAGVGDGLLAQLTAVVNLLAQGRACPAVMPMVAGAGLVALPKPDGGVRPIAVGELLRRLTGKCLMQVVRSEAKAYFWPAQVGVAVPSGAEAAVHCVRSWVARHTAGTQKCLVKLDFRNAFNLVSRDVVLREARLRFPALARWATWCYSAPSQLQFGTATLQSSAGVQQGDPLGPLLFAAAVQPLAQELRAGPLDLAMFYLDDGLLAGDVGAVAHALQHVQQRSAEIGLQLNLNKCKVVAVGATPDSAFPGPLPPSLCATADGQSRVVRDFEFLGAPVGSAPFVADSIRQRVTAAAALLDAIGGLDDPQVALRLLRHSASFCRVAYGMRCCPPTAQAAVLAEFDALVQRCFSAFTGMHLTDEQWQQAARSLKHAGLGLRSAQVHSSAAFLASLGGCLPQCQDLDCTYPRDLTASSDVVAAVAAVNTQLPPDKHLTPSAALQQKQKQLSSLLEVVGWEQQLASVSAMAKAGLLSEAEPGARAFLTAVPSGRTRMEPAHFVSELRARLGVPDASEDVWCPRCDAVLDRLSVHASMCVAGGERTQRHNALRDLIGTWAERAGLHPEKERPGLLLPQTPDDTRSARRRPADLYLPAFHGRPTAFDFAVTAPQRLDVLVEAGRGGGSAAAAYADVKRRHLDTATVCEQHGVAFVPLVVETTGAWAPEAGKILHQLSRAADLRHGGSGQPWGAATLLEEVSVLVRTWRARATLRRRAELAAAS